MKPLRTVPTFGSRLRRMRKHLGFTQDQAARMCGVSTRGWRRWEKDECLPELDRTPLLVDLSRRTPEPWSIGEIALWRMRTEWDISVGSLDADPA